jgi:hypothetical protein
MTDELDQLLAKEDDVVPSSGFTQAVMDAVRAAKAAPPPIPFPWTRALLSLGAIAVILGVSASGVIRVASLSAADGWSFTVPPAVHATIQAVAAPESIWTITALVLASASILGAMRTGAWLQRR